MEQTAHPPIADAVPDLEIAVAALAARQARANGPLLALANRLGGSLEGQLALLPAPVRDRLEAGVAQALAASFGLAGLAPDLGPRAPLLAAVASGALGGAGGLATAIAEMPVTITVMFSAIRAEARAQGFDPADPAVQAECLAVFGAGSPLAQDDGVNTSFLSARLTLTGGAVQSVIARIAPKLAAAMGQKLAAQAVPVVGALTGAALNAAYLRYFREIAAVRFGLLRLAQQHGPEPVRAAYRLASLPAATVRRA